MMLPPVDPRRVALNDEVHARPYQTLQAPQRASYLAMRMEPAEREREYAHVAELCGRFGCEPPPTEASYFVADCGGFRLRWERHGEFSSYTVFEAGAGGEPFAQPAVNALPPEWVAGLPGSLIVAAHVALLPGAEGLPNIEAISPHFGGNTLVGAQVADGGAAAFTDFRIHQDGYSRFLLLDNGMGRRRAGRVLQRLLEIETYRMFALLAFPLAREVGVKLAAAERDLAGITGQMVTQGSAEEPGLLDRLTQLAAAVEKELAASSYRFGAARAYYGLVRHRIAELREQRIPGIQTIDEFMERRLAPAMSTCESVARRQAELSERVARASDLLRTRVDIVREMQNQELLASMNRRARLQLRLQETVEGLSIAAITYYLVGLVGYAAKAFKSAGYAVDVEISMGVAIPLVALLAAFGIRYVRRSVAKEDRRR
ncbi:MAG: DUF3422 domain-containing protein [Burkholderiales bacterium]|nr:DUF3422 domain-containing protein [Burkholderiales bacterium]